MSRGFSGGKQVINFFQDKKSRPRPHGFSIKKIKGKALGTRLKKSRSSLFNILDNRIENEPLFILLKDNMANYGRK